MIKKYFSGQIEEIRNDTALRLYGLCLSIGHIFAVVNWFQKEKYKNLAITGDPLCWPFFENCYEYKFFTAEQVFGIIIGFGICAVIGAILFLPRKSVSAAYWWQIALNIFKILIYIQDYRLRMNQHYMHFFVTFAFLFMPNKRNVVRYLLVFIYVWAATLKFNYEWISGAALYIEPLFVGGRFLPVEVACVYVIFLEFVFVYGVLFKNKWIYWSTLLQLYLFHFVSWKSVGPFYPLLMYFLIAIFPLTYFSERTDNQPNLFKRFFTGKQPVSTYLFIGFFSFLQLVPVMMPGDEKVTGEGRLFALHMFDARVVCDGHIRLKYKDGTIDEINLPIKETARISCDPNVNFSRAKNFCWRLKNNPNFQDLDLYSEARKTHESQMRPLIDIQDFCSQNITYDLWRTNNWIRKN